MKVLFVCSGNNKNFDIVPFIKEQGEALRKQGVDIGYYPVIGKGLPGYIRAGFRLKKHLKQNPYDLVHAHFTLSGWAAVIGAGKIPVVLSVMGSDAYGEYIGVNRIQFSSRLYMFLTWLIQPFVKIIISKSENIEKHVYMKAKSFVIPNGVDVDKFKPVSCELNEFIHLKKNKKLILFIGKPDNIRKNFPLAQEAVARLKMDNVELVNPYPLKHNEVPGYLNAADVLIHTSLMEGSPNLVKEAMACNCPVVSTDIGDVKWLFGNTPGYYITSFNAKDIQEKLQAALEFSEEEGRTKGERRIAELGLGAEPIAKKIKGLYHKILGNHTDPAPAVRMNMKYQEEMVKTS
jgi:teichuronic acid biosynthesis glycosyltransferase TuaC